jgi:hypothetical protein
MGGVEVELIVKDEGHVEIQIQWKDGQMVL